MNVPCQLGGGVRDEATIAAWLDAGIERVIVGTQALKDPHWFRAMARRYPGRLVLGLDAKDGRVATAGWLDVSAVVATTLAEQFDDLPLAAVVYTDIASDGMLEGPNLAATEALARRLKTPVIASGGVGDPRGLWTPGGAADRGVHRRAGPVRRAFPTERGTAARRRPTSDTIRRASSTRPHLTRGATVRRTNQGGSQPPGSIRRGDETP